MVNRDSKGKSKLTNLTVFFNEMSRLANKRAVNAFHFDFRKAFDSVFPKTLVDKLIKYDLDEGTVEWT